MGVLYSSIHIVRNLYYRNMLVKCQLFKRALVLAVCHHPCKIVHHLFLSFPVSLAQMLASCYGHKHHTQSFRHTHINIPTCGVQRNCPEVFQFCRCAQTDSAQFNIKIYHMQGYVCGCGLQMLDMVILEHTPSLPCFHTFFTFFTFFFPNHFFSQNNALSKPFMLAF